MGENSSRIFIFYASICIIVSHICSTQLQIFAYKSEGPDKICIYQDKSNFFLKKFELKLHLWNSEGSKPGCWRISWQVNTTLNQYYTVISFAQNLTILYHFTQTSGALGKGRNEFILISKKGFKGESRRYIRLFSLPVSRGKPEVSAASLDKQQQQQWCRPLCVCGCVTAFVCTACAPRSF